MTSMTLARILAKNAWRTPRNRLMRWVILQSGRPYSRPKLNIGTTKVSSAVLLSNKPVAKTTVSATLGGYSLFLGERCCEILLRLPRKWQLNIATMFYARSSSRWEGRPVYESNFGKTTPIWSKRLAYSRCSPVATVSATLSSFPASKNAKRSSFFRVTFDPLALRIR